MRGKPPRPQRTGPLPVCVQNHLERRVGGRGLNLHELAVMTDTLGNLVLGEAMNRLEHTYRSLERTKKDLLSVDESMTLLTHTWQFI